MVQIDLLTQNTVEKASDQNMSQVMNMYIEEEQTTLLSQFPYQRFPDPPKGEYKVIAYSMFGLGLFCDTQQSNVRALYEQAGVVYCVAGNQFGTINSGGTFTSIGTLNTSSGWAKIVAITGGIDNNNQLVIIDGTNGYQYNIGTNTVDFPIANPNFIQTAVDITSQDDYVIVENSGSMQFYISNVSDSTTWQSIDFGSKFRQPDRLQALISFKGELWLFGTNTTEVWQNTGNNNFPFQRRSDVLIEQGVAAPRAVCIGSNALFYFGKSRTGGYALIIIDKNSYIPQVISLKPTMYQFSQLTTPTDCLMYAYAKDGHEFVDITFPTDNKTFTFDASNQTWVGRSSFANGVYGRFLGNCHCFGYGKSLVGDFNSGKVYYQSGSLFTENGTPFKRQWISPHVPNIQYKEAQGKRLYIHRLQIDVQTNVGNGTFLLEMSKDHGNTWESVATYTIPTTGDTTIYTTSLGSSFTFTFRITTTDNIDLILLGFIAEASIGNW